ncbi:MAG TPA: ATP-binding cassette domain-containing protein, partial [Methanolinea sp.]|nr:ATP-binding cassette domain-containing protein [Methanolinea sp.]
MLEVTNLNAFYSNLHILWDVSLSVGEGEIVTLLGANGAGKTTLVQSLFGFIPRIEGKVVFNGRDVTGMHPYDVVKEGLSLVPEKRELFPKMTVAENLELGGYSRSGDARDLEEIFEL